MFLTLKRSVQNDRLEHKKHISEILDFIKVKIDMLEGELLANPININNLDEIIENGNKAVRIDELKRVFEFIKRCAE